MAKTDNKKNARDKRIKRIRKNLSGTTDRPRLRVFRSLNHIYAQIIDDTKGATLVAMSTLDKAIKEGEAKSKKDKAHQVGVLIAEKAKAAGVNAVVFDRGGYLYHGRVKALSEGAREGGLEF
ncbi:MAG: 50S ribosomal protein L18 [Desulfobulbaceae bacterium]|nr:MAG: 50S ribosomal protein L18 [Desulfobulbaceae bacterium]